MWTVESLEKLEELLPKVQEVLEMAQNISLLADTEAKKSAEEKIKELKEALKSDDIDEVKKALKKAIKMLNDWIKVYGYGYPEPNVDTNTAENTEKNENQEPAPDINVLEELERLKQELELEKAEKEALMKELTFTKRVEELKKINPNENWEDVKDTITKLADDEFEKFVEKLEKVSVKGQKSKSSPSAMIPEPPTSEVPEESLAESFAKFLKSKKGGVS